MNHISRTYLLLLFFLTLHLPVLSQTIISDKEQTLKQLSGYEKLVALNELSGLYKESNIKKAVRYGRQAAQMADNFIVSTTDFDTFENQFFIDCKLNYGKLLYKRENYLDAKKTFEETQLAAIEFQYESGETQANIYLSKIDSLASAGKVKQNFLSRALSDLDIVSAFSNSKNSVTTSTELKLAQLYEKRGDTTVAIGHYEKAAELLRNRGEIDKAEEIEYKITNYRALKRMDSIRKEIVYRPDSTVNILSRRIEQDSIGSLIIPEMQSELVLSNLNEMADLKEKASELEDARDFEGSLEFYKRYAAMQQKYQSDSALQVTAYNLVESEMERLQAQNQIGDLKITAIQKEKEAEVRLKNILIIIAAFIASGLIAILFLYLSKRKKHRLLTTAYTDLDTTKGQLEKVQEHVSKLLQQQVSPEIAIALIEDKPQRKKQYVAVMFLDIRGFTPIAEKMDPEELIEYQNNVFGFMIEIIREYSGNINQFMGDGFMATFGAPVSHGNDSRNAFLAATRILEEIKSRNDSKQIPFTTLGIGIHAGHVVTGNVGTESRKQFSVTGNTVIIAARVEQLNKQYGAQLIITEEVFKSLELDDWKGTPDMKPVKVKGRSEPVNILVMVKATTTVS